MGKFEVSKSTTVEQLAGAIISWEHDAGESFSDYFSHGTIKDVSWAFWLVGKGFSGHAEVIIAELNGGNKCLDQDLLYDIYPEQDDDLDYDLICKNHDKNIKIMAEFLLATSTYKSRITKFLKED